MKEKATLYSYSEYEEVIKQREEARQNKDWDRFHELTAQAGMMKASLRPEAGMKVTEHLWSDSHAYTVVRVITDNKVIVCQNVVNGYGYGDLTKYVTNELDGETAIEISRRKNGLWYQVGCPAKRGEVRYSLGNWHEYIDPNF